MRQWHVLKKAGDATGRYVRQMGGRYDFGVIHLRLEPLAQPEAKLLVLDRLLQDDPVREFLPAVALGVQDAAYAAGLLGATVMVRGGEMHLVDSRTRSFRQAAILGVKAILERDGLLAVVPPPGAVPLVRMVERSARVTVGPFTVEIEPTGSGRDAEPTWAAATWVNIDKHTVDTISEAVRVLSASSPPWVDLNLLFREGIHGHPVDPAAVGTAITAALAAGAPGVRERLGPLLQRDERGG
jgi:hypothetical protein